MAGLETGSQTELYSYLSEPGVGVDIFTHRMVRIGVEIFTNGMVGNVGKETKLPLPETN